MAQEMLFLGKENNMKKNPIKANAKLIKGGIQYLRGKLTNNRKKQMDGLTNYLRGKYL
jgi:uncharacterized protein YjbJ (UPF0337 family)